MLQDIEIKRNILETIEELNHFGHPATDANIYRGSQAKDHIVFERIIEEMIFNDEITMIDDGIYAIKGGGEN